MPPWQAAALGLKDGLPDRNPEPSDTIALLAVVAANLSSAIAAAALIAEFAMLVSVLLSAFIPLLVNAVVLLVYTTVPLTSGNVKVLVVAVVIAERSNCTFLLVSA